MAIRLGDIRFLNSWPVTYALKAGLVETQVNVVSATPTELNCRLLTGELDASAVSSMLYLRHQMEFVPIPGLCIRSDGGIRSVLLVSRKPLEHLKGRTIGITNQGATTPILLKLLLRKRGLEVDCQTSPLRYPHILEKYPAALLIGDEALEASQSSNGWLTWDLGEAWSAWTELPFVFALWVIRRTLVEEKPQLLPTISQALLSSYEWSKAHPKELVAAMRKVFPWETPFLIQYLAGLSYELGETAWGGLRRFAKEAEAIGELPKGTTRKIRGAWILGRESLVAVE